MCSDKVKHVGFWMQTVVYLCLLIDLQQLTRNKTSTVNTDPATQSHLI